MTVGCRDRLGVLRVRAVVGDDRARVVAVLDRGRVVDLPPHRHHRGVPVGGVPDGVLLVLGQLLSALYGGQDAGLGDLALGRQAIHRGAGGHVPAAGLAAAVERGEPVSLLGGRDRRLLAPHLVSAGTVRSGHHGTPSGAALVAGQEPRLDQGLDPGAGHLAAS
ncbi:hypothetical protein QMK19_29010 [Streptomyces sp. H10-C2]|uniref:hypothetical protein n=1 Tax=Streptomyces fildesensis TaxID=375757 RepID=UPI0018DF609A|nr:hypothetical protein [Streptomyces fildesensis]MDJ0344251.1 hypothetical protein [Streptomyces sp. PH10-H1]MDJ0373589.1 hypothetical protein [Streptomyces sp. H10-C2]